MGRLDLQLLKHWKTSKRSNLKCTGEPKKDIPGHAQFMPL